MIIEQRSYYEQLERQQQIETKKRKKSYKKLKRLGQIAVILCIGIVIISRYATIINISYQNSELTKYYNQISTQNKELQLELTKSKDLNKIQEIATKKLNMVTPDQTQIVYVNVPKVTEKKAVVKEEPKKNLFERLLAIIK